jgi:hypothetical protein
MLEPNPATSAKALKVVFSMKEPGITKNGVIDEIRKASRGFRQQYQFPK